MRCRGPGLRSGARLPHSALSPGHEGWGEGGNTESPGAKIWVIVLIRSSECEKTWAAGCIMSVLTTGQQTLCDANQKYLEKLLWQMTEYQGLLLMSEPIETNIYSLYHWQLPGYWIYGHGKNLLCFKIMTRPPGAVRSGHWIIAAWKSVFVTCL